MKLPLSDRLLTCCNFVRPGDRVADVGCDHGFLSIYLVQQGISPAVVAGDVRIGPLSAAKAHVAEHKLEAYIETRLSDGLEKYKPGESDTLICAGMGGPLMQRILMEHREVTDSFKEFVLQPQSELEEFRIFLREHGFLVEDENILCEDGKYYFMFRVTPGWENGIETNRAEQNADYQRLCDKYGALLLQRRHPVLREYLEKGLAGSLAVRKQLLAHRGEEGSNERLEQRIRDNTQEIGDLQTALTMFNKEV